MSSGEGGNDRRFNVLVASDDDGNFCDYVETCGSDTIAAFKASLIQHPRCNYHGVAGITLTLGETELDNHRLVRDYNINEDSFLNMTIRTATTYDKPSTRDDVIDFEEKEIRIYIGFLSKDEKGFELDVDQSTTIEGLKALIMSKKPDCEPNMQRIFLNQTNLDDDNTLAHYNIDNGDNLFVMLKDPDLIPPMAGYMLLYVRFDDNIHTIHLESNNATIRHVKKLVWEKTDILPAFQRLNFCGENLEFPDQQLSDCCRDGGIKTESLLYLFRRSEWDPEPGYSELPPGVNPDLQSVVQNSNTQVENSNTQVKEDRQMITIYLMNPSLGDSDTGIPFHLNKNAPLRQIFHAYSVRVAMPASSLQFLHGEYGDLTSDCELSAEALGIDDSSMILVVPNIEDTMPTSPQRSLSNEIDLTPFSSGSVESIKVTLKGIGQDVPAKINRDDTSLQLLFDYFAEKQGVESESLFYFCNGKLFSYKTDKTAAQCGIEDGDIIHASRRTDEEKKSIVIIANFINSHRQRRKAQKIVADQRKARKIIDNFVWKSFAGSRRRQQRAMAKMVQKTIRGYLARKIYGDKVQARLLEFRSFTTVWKQTADLAAKRASAPRQTLSGWALVREGINLKKMEYIDENGNLADTDEKLNKALAGALEVDDDVDSDLEDEAEPDLDDTMKNSSTETPMIDWSQFMITSHVCKFLKNGDTKYREIFVKKMKQLAKGERSHKLQKPLQGCESVVYETYLENKSGWRILWTQEGERLVIWFVCQHKSVSRLARLIDDAKNRTARQKLPDSFVSEMENGLFRHEEKMDLKLDPIGNVPLKLYDISFDKVNEIVDESWSPQMHLTKEERDVVEAKGTVLLLGRSGTGKTVCICNRMEFDRERLGNKADFSQLFVSRSKQLCRYVKDAVGVSEKSEFTTFDKLVANIEASLSQIISHQRLQRGRHVDFSRFRNEFFSPRYPQEDASALIAWKAIRTFIKGSIEAFQQTGAVLSRESFAELGKNRCKVPLHLRDSLYDIFMQYQQWTSEQHVWDDCDRIFALLKGIEEIKKSHSQVFEEEVKKMRVYVDEVQDYTQIEILLFFYISGGPGALFLAGDPAQSVIEGTDFRFKEIRSVGYYVAGNRRHLIPEKPKVVNVNFRSHAGVLNCAGSLLDLLFAHFPGSANQLKKDLGLFKGARPGVFQNVQIQQLSTLLKEKMPGAVVLTHDDSAALWRDRLDHRLVYGIREAKGMEFKSVIILDFFAELPSSLQKPWRDLLLNRYGEEDEFQQKFPLVETHLKLVYTAVTRCIEQLFFAETCSSISGDAAVRWLTTTSAMIDKASSKSAQIIATKEALATINNVKDLEAMSMTNDEFCVVGIDNAQLAENDNDLQPESILDYLDRAIYCFQKSQSPELVAKAQVHSQSVRLRDRLTHTEASMSTWDRESLEKEASQTIILLLKENLFAESLNLLNEITRLVPPYTQQKLEEYIASPINMLNT